MAFKRGTAVHCIIATLIVLSAQLAYAQNHGQNRGLKVVLDPAQTEIHWKLSGGLHTTHGTFKLKSGEFFFNPATGVAEGEILVDATTGESGNATRDKRMQDEVLESNRYPAIFFHPNPDQGRIRSGRRDAGAGGGGHIQHPRSRSSPGVAAQGAGCRGRGHGHHAIYRSLRGLGNEESQ